MLILKQFIDPILSTVASAIAIFSAAIGSPAIPPTPIVATTTAQSFDQRGNQGQINLNTGPGTINATNTTIHKQDFDPNSLVVINKVLLPEANKLIGGKYVTEFEVEYRSGIGLPQPFNPKPKDDRCVFIPVLDAATGKLFEYAQVGEVAGIRVLESKAARCTSNVPVDVESYVFE